MIAPTGKPQTPYDALGGKDVIARIVNHFYDLMDSEAQYAQLRAMHAADLGPMRHSLTGWLCAWAGGPRDWFEENPGTCMMSVHRKLNMRRELADQWSDAMARAIAECGPQDRELGRMMAQRLDTMAQAMVAEAA